MKKKTILLNLIVLILSLISVIAVDITENFDGYTISQNFGDFDDIDSSNIVSTVDYITRDNYTVYFGKYTNPGVPGGCIYNEQININDYYGGIDDNGNQIKLPYTDDCQPDYNPFIIIFAFDDFINFDNSTIEINITGNVTNAVSDSFVTYLIFKNLDNTCSRVYRAVNANIDNSVFCDSVITSRNTGVIISGTTPNSESYSIIESENNVKYLYFLIEDSSTPGETFTYYFDEISIKNVILGVNQLPTFNVTINDSIQCLGEEENSKTFYFNISSEDFENNTILYSLDTYSLSNITVSKQYSKTRILPFNVQLPFYIGGSLDEYFYISNSCQLAEVPNNFNLSEETFSLIRSYNKDNILRYMLRISDNCVGNDKTFYIQNQRIFSDFAYGTELYDLENNDDFNLTFYDSEKENIIVQLNLNITNGILYVNHIINNTIYDNVLNRTIIDKYMRISIGDRYNDSTKFNVYLRDSNNVGNSILGLNKTNIDDYGLIGLGINNGKIYQEKYYYAGLFSSPTFSEVKPNNITISDIGVSYFTISVKDNINTDYTTKTYAVQLMPYDFCIDIGSNNFENLIPETHSKYINDLIYALRQLYVLALTTNMLSYLYIGIKLGLIILLYKRYKYLTEQAGKTSEEAIKIIAITTFVIVNILYLALLIERVWFVSFAIVGILYLSNSLLTALGTINNTDTEKAIIYSTAFFSILIYLYFSLFGYVSGVSFGNPSLKEIDFTNPTNSVNSIWGFFMEVLFYTIPDTPIFLNLIFILFRVISYYSLIIVIKNTINPLTEG